MKVYGRRRGRRPVATLLSLVMVLAGVALIGHTFLGGGSALATVTGAFTSRAEAPPDTAMKLTIPKMSRVEEDPVYDAASTDSTALNKGAVHLEGTGYPWEAEANVYIAAHRLGYAGTGSFLQFYNLDKLENGDEIILTDSGGTEYTYTVFKKLEVSPTDYDVTATLPGGNIVSLQTCTLPDYSKRLVVQGELTSVA